MLIGVFIKKGNKYGYTKISGNNATTAFLSKGWGAADS